MRLPSKTAQYNHATYLKHFFILFCQCELCIPDAKVKPFLCWLHCSICDLYCFTVIYLLINGGVDYDSSEGVIGAVLMTKVFLDKASHFSCVCVMQC